MLLSILLVADKENTQGAQMAAAAVRKQMEAMECWKDQYELIPLGLSSKDLDQASGHFSVINALVVQQFGLSMCQGEYVWILPSFISLGDDKAAWGALHDVLSLKLGAVALCPLSGSARQNELVRSPLQLLQPAHQFEEYRYILPRAAMLECYAKESGVDTSLTYLLSRSFQKGTTMYAKIPLELTVVMGVASHSLLVMSLSYFSGTRPWQREALSLPEGLVARFVNGETPGVLLPGEVDSLKHFLFSACSALDFFTRTIFSDSAVAMEKKQSFVVVSKIVNYFAQLASALKVTSSLVPHITRLKFFIDQWIAFAAAPITSENVSDPDAKRGVFDGVWWLDRELKDDFNKMGAEKMIGLLNSIRHAIEVAKFDPV